MDTAEGWRLVLTRIYFLLYCKHFPISILIIFRLLSIILLTKHTSCQDSEPASSTWPDLKSFHLQTAVLPASSNFSKPPLNHHVDPRFNLATCFLHSSFITAFQMLYEFGPRFYFKSLHYKENIGPWFFPFPCRFSWTATSPDCSDSLPPFIFTISVPDLQMLPSSL